MITPLPSYAVVSNMRLRHDQTVIADLRKHATAGATAMDRHELANMVALPNARFGWFSLVLQILRGQSNRNERENMGAVADGRAAVNDAMGLQTNAVAQFNFVANDRIRTDVAVATNARAAADNGGRMNVSRMSGSGHRLRMGKGEWE